KNLGTSDQRVKSWPDKVLAREELERWNRFTREHALPIVEGWRRARYGPALRAIRPALSRYEQLRHEDGSFSVQTLLLKAAVLIRAYPSVPRYFRERFTHLLVDEFQDTDPIQAEVMLLLTSDDPQETDWRRCKPVPGSLFVVGDPKQSIYRFRRADIQTYQTVRRLIEQSGGRSVTLSPNLRSTGAPCDWINRPLGHPGSFPPPAPPPTAP